MEVERGGLGVVLGGGFGLGFCEEGIACGEESFSVRVQVCVIDAVLMKYRK